MQDFLSVFKKNKGAKPISQNNIRIPDFNNKSHELDAESFVLYGDASEVNFSNAGDKLPYIRFSSKTKMAIADENFQKVLRQHFPKNIIFEETIKDILDGRHQTAEDKYYTTTCDPNVASLVGLTQSMKK